MAFLRVDVPAHASIGTYSVVNDDEGGEEDTEIVQIRYPSWFWLARRDRELRGYELGGIWEGGGEEGLPFIGSSHTACSWAERDPP